jgi:hypothetical protein
MNQIGKDISLLNHFNLMDYSLLFVIEYNPEYVKENPFEFLHEEEVIVIDLNRFRALKVNLSSPFVVNGNLLSSCGEYGDTYNGLIIIILLLQLLLHLLLLLLLNSVIQVIR